MTVVPDQQILRGVTATLRWQNLDGDGSPAAPTGDVTVGVVNSAGTVVLASGTATGGSDANPRTVALTPAQNASLDLLTATWTDTGDGSTHSTLVEVVGGYLFSIAEAREADKVLANDQKWSDAKIIEQRRKIEEEFEEICAVAFVPRFRIDRLQSRGGCAIVLDRSMIRSVRSITSYTADTPDVWTAGDLAAVEKTGPTLHSRAGKDFPAGTVVVGYEHGYDRPPAELKTAAFQRLRYLLAQPNSGIHERATSYVQAEGGGSFRLDTAGRHKTGQPDVDAVLDRWSERVGGIA